MELRNNYYRIRTFLRPWIAFRFGGPAICHLWTNIQLVVLDRSPLILQEQGLPGLSPNRSLPMITLSDLRAGLVLSFQSMLKSLKIRTNTLKPTTCCRLSIRVITFYSASLQVITSSAHGWCTTYDTSVWSVKSTLLFHWCAMVAHGGGSRSCSDLVVFNLDTTSLIPSVWMLVEDYVHSCIRKARIQALFARFLPLF